jgi:hypothetical protein
MRRPVSNGVVEEGCTIAKASQNVVVVEGHETKGRGKPFTVLDDAISRCGARVRIIPC